MMELPQSFLQELQKNNQPAWHPNIVISPMKKVLHEEEIDFDQKPKYTSFLEIKSEIQSKQETVPDMSANKEAGNLVLSSPKMNCACRFVRDNSKGDDSMSQSKAMTAAGLPQFKEISGNLDDIDEKVEESIPIQMKSNQTLTSDGQDILSNQTSYNQIKRDQNDQTLLTQVDQIQNQLKSQKSGPNQDHMISQIQSILNVLQQHQNNQIQKPKNNHIDQNKLYAEKLGLNNYQNDIDQMVQNYQSQLQRFKSSFDPYILNQAPQFTQNSPRYLQQQSSYPQLQPSYVQQQPMYQSQQPIYSQQQPIYSAQQQQNSYFQQPYIQQQIQQQPFIQQLPQMQLQQPSQQIDEDIQQDVLQLLQQQRQRQNFQNTIMPIY